METQIFHHAKIQSSKKNPLKETKKVLQDIITLELISSFNTSLAKDHLSKILI
jgi:hypothetical protein